MTVIFPLKNYFNSDVYKRIISSKNPFFQSLIDFDVDFVGEVLSNFSSYQLEIKSLDMKKELSAFIKVHVAAHKGNDDRYIDKKNYLLKNKFLDLLPDRKLNNAQVIAVSSGSSGVPYFWPRGYYLELETTIIHELLLKYIFNIHKEKTLFINAYSMGMYVAGVFTNNAVTRIAQRGYDISIINPGISVEDVIRIIKEIGENYTQIIISGYPPFVQDIVEFGTKSGIDWSDVNIKFIFGAEAISEEWRSNLLSLAHQEDRYHSSFNTYGSADLAVLGHETPFSILVKELMTQNKYLYESILNQRSVSTLVQYHPCLKYFEEENGELLCSGLGGMPLLNYNLHDHGSIYSFDELISLFESQNIDILQISRKKKIAVWKLPFIVLFGKSDQTVTLYGLNVYPQTIRKALDDKKISHLVTGRSTISTEYTRKGRQFLNIQIELRESVKKDNALKNKIGITVKETLLAENYEYRTLYSKIGETAIPVIELIEYGQIAHNRGIKQQWIKKV